MEEQEVKNSLEAIFKEMTPNNIEHHIAELTEQSSKMSPDTMGNIIDILFNKASSVRPECNHIYIYFCRIILPLEVKTSSGETLKFKDLMQMRCQSHLIELLEKNKRLQIQQNQVLSSEREKLLAFTTFVGELYNHDALTLETVQACLKALLAVKGDLPLLCVCRLLKDVGKFLDSDEGKVSVNEIFTNFYQMIKGDTVPAEVSFMLCDLCDRRENNWSSKGMQLTTIKRIREETQLPGSIPASQSEVHTSEPAARPSQEAVVKNDKDISQTVNSEIDTQKVSVKEVSMETCNQDKSLKEVTKNSCEKTVKSETMMLKYREGQWSPINPQGQMKYSRGFLLQIRPYCTTKPKGLPTGLPVLDHCRLDEENEQFNKRKGTSGFEKKSQNTLKEDGRIATSSSTSSGQRRATSRPDKVENTNDKKNSFEDKKQNGAVRQDKTRTNVQNSNGLREGSPHLKDPKNLPKKGETRQHHRTERAQSLPEVSCRDKYQDQAVSQGDRASSQSPSLPVSASGSSHGGETMMNSCIKVSSNSSQKPSQVQLKCRSLPPCGMHNEHIGAEVARGQESAKDQVLSKRAEKGKEAKRENERVAREQQISSDTSTAEGPEVSSLEKSEPTLSEEEYETRAESIIEQYLKLNNSQAVKSRIDKLQTPHLQHMFIRLSIGRVIDGQERSSEAIGRLFHELLSSGTISEEQFCKGLNDYLAVTEQIAEFTRRYWSLLGEIIGAMVSGGTKNLEFLKEVIQTTPGDGKAAVFMAEILKACIKLTGNIYQVLRLWKASNFSWSLFIADTWSIKSFVEKQALDFTLSLEERSARKTSKQVPQRTESDSVTTQSSDEIRRGQQTEKDSIPKLQSDLMVLLKGNHLQHRAVFDIIENAVSEDLRNTEEFIHALVLVVCLSSMMEGDDGPYTKCQRELLKRRAVLIQRYIHGSKDLEMIALQVVVALCASLGNPRGVLRTMCEVLYDEDVISGETFFSWRDSEDFSEENERATMKFFESLDQNY